MVGRILIDAFCFGEKPWDFSLDESSPYFAPAATWDRTCNLPLCAIPSSANHFYSFGHRGVSYLFRQGVNDIIVFFKQSIK